MRSWSSRETVATMAATTNLSSDQAATAFGQISNIMGTATEDFGLGSGSTIVDLGNKGQSTEQQIVEMALRIAPTANQVGLLEHQALGWSNAIASLGINAEKPRDVAVNKVLQGYRAGGRHRR